MQLKPPTAEERHNLSILTKNEEFAEDFDRAVLRFTDATAEELRKAATGKGSADSAYNSAASDANNFLRTKMGENIHLRLLEDVLSTGAGGYFRAILRGKTHAHMIFTLDPHGAPEVKPEQVSLLLWNEWGPMYATAFRSTAAGAGSGEPFHGGDEDLDVTIEKSGFLTGLATVRITADEDGLAVLPLELYPTLRVSKVETESGEALNWVQEKKDEDADFGVVLAHPLKKGETATLRIAYGGKEVVTNEGAQNYYPVGRARESWYPNPSTSLGNYNNYHMFFHVPKGLQVIATGTRVSEKTQGNLSTSEWKTAQPIAVAGFNLGSFTSSEATVGDGKTASLTVAALPAGIEHGAIKDFRLPAFMEKSNQHRLGHAQRAAPEQRQPCHGDG